MGSQTKAAYVIASAAADNDARILKEARSLAASGRPLKILHFPKNSYNNNDLRDNPLNKEFEFHPILWKWRATALAGILALILTFAAYAAIAFDLVLPAALLVITSAAYAFTRLRTQLGGLTPRAIIKTFARFITHRSKTAALGAALRKTSRTRILHVHETEALAMITRLKKSGLSGALIYDAHELYEDMAGAPASTSEGARRIHKHAAKNIDQWITVSEEISAYYQKAYCIDAPIVVANALSAPANMPPYDGRLHDAAELDADAKILLFHGGITAGRGLESLVDSFTQKHPSTLPTDNIDWRLVFMGEGPAKSQLQERAQGNAVFIPPAPNSELLDWVRGASLGVIPYPDSCLNHRYCAPNKLWEYAAAGVPILASHLTTLTKLIEEYNMGWLFETAPDKSTALTLRRTLAAIDHNALGRAQNGASDFMLSHDWPKYEAAMLAAYNRLDRL